jgi:hypothetical protein
MTKRKPRCQIIVETTYGAHDEYPLSKNGWAQAHKRSLEHARGDRLALTDLVCEGAHIPLYQCGGDSTPGSTERRISCGIENVGGGNDPRGDRVLCARKSDNKPVEPQKPILGGAYRR